MRIWTLHPKYLDRPGLLAAWREAWLAWSVLDRPTAGYGKHPELARWRQAITPRASLAAHMRATREEMLCRGWRPKDFPDVGQPMTYLPVSEETVYTERMILLTKLFRRNDIERYTLLADSALPDLNPVFQVAEPGG